MAKQAYVYSGTDWVPLASEVTNLTAYQTKALAQAPYRNLIINGDMQVAQRGTSVASITTGGYYTLQIDGNLLIVIFGNLDSICRKRCTNRFRFS
jgi:hypothetical protein